MTVCDGLFGGVNRQPVAQFLLGAGAQFFGLIGVVIQVKAVELLNLVEDHLADFERRGIKRVDNPLAAFLGVGFGTPGMVRAPIFPLSVGGRKVSIGDRAKRAKNAVLHAPVG